MRPSVRSEGMLSDSSVLVLEHSGRDILRIQVSNIVHVIIDTVIVLALYSSAR